MRDEKDEVFGSLLMAAATFLIVGVGFLGQCAGEKRGTERLCKKHFGKAAVVHEGKCFIRREDGAIMPVKEAK